VNIVVDAPTNQLTQFNSVTVYGFCDPDDVYIDSDGTPSTRPTVALTPDALGTVGPANGLSILGTIYIYRRDSSNQVGHTHDAAECLAHRESVAMLGAAAVRQILARGDAVT
jgi:hypothetical protein